MKPPEKQLQCSLAASAHSKAQFSELRHHVLDERRPYVLSNAELPHEIFETLGLPVVTGEWWGGVISAKQLAGSYMAALQTMGFHDGLGAYNSLGLISLIVDGIEPPWGGLPPPALICAPHREQTAERVNSMVASRLGVPYVGIEMPAAGRFHERWWELARRDWERLYEPERLDMMTEQYWEMIRVAEGIAGRSLDLDALRARLECVNRQEEYFDQARELIATAPRCPARANERMTNVMTAQWSRGTDWAESHARAFRDEVAARVANGQSVIADERHRLLWAGVGLWQDVGFYSAFEDSHGAVFVWEMNLALASDAYPKYGLSDPVRALAARYLHMGELAHVPPWAGAWMVHEARRHRVDGAVMLASTAQRHQVTGNVFQREALEAAGIPVLEIFADPNDNRSWDRAAMIARVAQFIEERVER